MKITSDPDNGKIKVYRLTETICLNVSDDDGKSSVLLDRRNLGRLIDKLERELYRLDTP